MITSEKYFLFIREINNSDDILNLLLTAGDELFTEKMSLTVSVMCFTVSFLHFTEHT